MTASAEVLTEEEKRLLLDMQIAIHAFGLPAEWAEQNFDMPLPAFSTDRNMTEVLNQRMQKKFVSSQDPVTYGSWDSHLRLPSGTRIDPVTYGAWDRELEASARKWLGAGDLSTFNLTSVLMVLTPDEICMAALRALNVYPGEF